MELECRRALKIGIALNGLMLLIYVEQELAEIQIIAQQLLTSPSKVKIVVWDLEGVFQIGLVQITESVLMDLKKEFAMIQRVAELKQTSQMKPANVEQI